MTGEPIPAEISDWAEAAGAELVSALLADDFTRRAGVLHAATQDPITAYQVIIVTARLAGQILRPNGHAGGPIGNLSPGVDDRLMRLASQLVGFAAQGDFGMADALTRAVLSDRTNPLLEARTLLWAILEIIAIEPVKDQP